MNAADIMTRNPICIEPHAAIAKAVRLMLQHRISGLPVVDGKGALIGVVTEGDFLRRAETGTQRRRPKWVEFLIGPGRLANEYVHAFGRKVEEVMSTDPRAIREDTPLDEIVQMMERHQIKRLPVLRDHKVVGIVSRANLLRALASVIHETKPASVDDVPIRTRLLTELAMQPWAPAALINVIVRDGTVHLWGALTNENQRQGIRVIAENIPGVKAVQDHLVWVEPITGMTLSALDDETQAGKPQSAAS